MRRKTKNNRLVCEELEPRLLFSADGFDLTPSTSEQLIGRNIEVVLDNAELAALGLADAQQPVKQALNVVVNNDETLVNPTSPNLEVTSGLNRGGANSIAMDAAGNTVVVWSDSARDSSGWGVYAQRFDANGDKVGAEIQVNTNTTGDQQYASVAMDDSGRFVVAFSADDGSVEGIYLRRFNADGTAIDSADVLVNAGNTGGSQVNPTIAVNASGQMAVAWESNGSVPGLYARHFDMTSAAPGDQLPTTLITVEASIAANEPSIDINTSGRIVVTWEQDGDLFGRRYDHGNSTALSTRHDLNLAGSNEGSMTVAVQDTGEFAIAYRSDVFFFNGIWARHFHASGAAQATSTLVSGTGQNPSISAGIDDSFIVVYEDSDVSGNGVFAQKYDANRNSVGSVFQVNTSTIGDQDDASIAVHDIDNFAVVWNGNGTQTGNVDANGVFKRQFGTAVVNTAPVATNLSSAETFIEDTPLDLTDIVVSDADDTETTVTLTLSDNSAGSLSTGTSGSVTSTFNSGTGVWQASGAIADVNNLLANLVFAPSLNYNSDFSINTSVSDGVASPLTGTKSMTAIADDDAWHLMLATFDVSSPSGAPGLDSWTDSTFLRFSDPGFALGAGTTNGSFSGVFELDDFSASGSRLHAIHYVSRDLSLGGASSPAINVKAGDVLFATQSNETLSSVNSISIESKDVVLFSPSVAGDYSSGTFTIVLDDVDGSNLDAISLVERDTVLADGTLLNEGDFLFATGSKELGWFVTDDVGAGTTSGTTRVLLDGDDTNVDLSSDLRGIDLVETGTTLGGVVLNSGDILISTKDSITGGQNAQAFTNNDVVRLDIGQTTWSAGSGNGSANADILLQGANVGLDSNSERVNALSMVTSLGASNNAPLATNLSTSENYSEDTTLDLTDIFVSDVDNTTTIATLTVSDTAAGSLSVATSGAVTSTYNPSTGMWQASGAIADVNALLSDVSFSPNLNYNSNFSIATSVDDGIASPVTGSKLFTATPVNDAPIATNLSDAETYTEDTIENLIDIVVSDVDNSTTTVRLTLSDLAAGSLSTATSGAVTSTYNSGTGVWQASGAIADVNALLSDVSFSPNLNYNSNFSIATSVDDGIASPVTGSKLFTATPVNDAPIATNLSDAESYTEDTIENLIDIVVSDIDNSTTTVRLTLSDLAAGSLSTATSGAVTSTYNSGTGVWQASGAIADVNALLSDVSFSPNLNYNSNFSIATSVDDGIAPAVTGNKSFTATPENDAPNATNLNASENYVEDATLNLIDTIVTDVDSASVTVTMVLSDTGAGSLSTATSGAITSTFNTSTGEWRASGAIADVNSLLEGVSFTPRLNYDSNFNIATSVDDGIASPVTGSKLFTATPVNDAPNATNLSDAETYTEDTTQNLIDIVVSDIDNTTTTVTLTLSDINAGSLSTASSGAVTSTFNPGTGEWQASGALADVNSLLQDLSFIPGSNYDSNFNITTSVDDGVAAPITGTKLFTAIPVNDAPKATNLSSPETYLEDNPLNLTDIVASDLDDSATRVILQLSDPNAGSLNTDSSGAVTSTYNAGSGTWFASGAISDVNTLLADLIFTPASNYSSDFTIQTSVDDSVNPPFTGTKVFTATASNDAPTVSNLNAAESYVENSSINLVDIIVSDSDSPNVTVTLTLSDSTAGVLSTSSSGVVSSSYNSVTGVWAASGAIADINNILASVEFQPALNYSSDFAIEVSVSDGIAPAVLGSKPVTGNGLNDEPSGEIAIESSGAVTVGDTLSFSSTISDADGIVGSISYQWQRDGNDILGANSNSYVLTEADAGAAISIVATYIDGLGNTESISSTTSVAVLPSNQAPSLSLSDSSIALVENFDTSQRVALSEITVQDDNQGENSLLLTGPNADLFEIEDNILYLKAGVLLDYETAVRLEVSVAVDDETVGTGIDDSEVFQLTVEDLDETESQFLPPFDAPEVVEPSLSGTVPATTDAVEEPAETEQVDEIVAENTSSEPLERLPGTGGDLNVVQEPVQIEVSSGIDGIPTDQVIRSAFVEQTDNTFGRATINVALLNQLSGLNLDDALPQTRQLQFDDEPFVDAMADFSILENSSFVNGLDDVRLVLQDKQENDRMLVGSTIMTTTSLSIGYVVWLIRGSVLLSSLLSSVPAWRIIDPLPVLAGALDDAEEDEESLQSILEDQETDATPEQEDIEDIEDIEGEPDSP